jgi:hypothetical protein
MDVRCFRVPPKVSSLKPGVHLPQVKEHYSKGPNRVGASLSSPEHGNRSSFRNVVLSSYFEFRTMEKGNKPNDSEYFSFVNTWKSTLNFTVSCDVTVYRFIEMYRRFRSTWFLCFQPPFWNEYSNPLVNWRRPFLPTVFSVDNPPIKRIDLPRCDPSSNLTSHGHPPWGLPYCVSQTIGNNYHRVLW